MEIVFWVSAFLVLVVVVAYLAGGYVVYDKLTKIVAYPDRFENTPPDFLMVYEDVAAFDTSPYLVTRYEEVSFPSRGGDVTLAGWYLDAGPGAPAVVVTHGIGAGKFASNVLVPAGMLFKNGFNVLIYDLRNHGKSGVDNGRTSVGNKEYLDVLGAWDYLVSERGFDPGRVGLYGISLGGGTTLNAFSAEPRAAAAAVDSPFSDLQKIIAEELARSGVPVILAPAAVFMARMVAGVDIAERSPQDAVRRDAGRPLFLIHGTADSRVNVHHSRSLEALARQTGANVKAWYVEGAGHVQSVFTNPREYEEKLVGFFREALGGDRESNHFTE